MIEPNNIKRVVAYTRVSTESEMQSSSLAHQREYYAGYIASRPDWIFSGLFSDTQSGTTIEQRPGLRALLEKCRAKEIDIVLVKSVSRLARNTVDLLKITRELKSLGIIVYFETAKISTESPNHEAVLSILACLAQEESRNISENIHWGFVRKMEKGQLPSKHSLYGYKFDKEGNYVIAPRQAKIVRQIFEMHDKGLSANKIATILTKRKIKSPKGKKIWYQSTVSGILNNEKYHGEIRLQKTCVVDFLTHKRVKNRGNIDSYLITDSDIPPIITKPTDS